MDDSAESIFLFLRRALSSCSDVDGPALPPCLEWVFPASCFNFKVHENSSNSAMILSIGACCNRSYCIS